MECNTFEELLYRDLLISDSMEKNTLKEFPSEERKVLMQLLFPLKDRERFFYLYQDMTLEQYTAKVVTKIYAALSGSKSSAARLPQERITVG